MGSSLSAALLPPSLAAWSQHVGLQPGRLCAGGCLRDFSRPAGAADSLGLLKNVRALQSSREGVKRKGRRDLISSWGEVSQIPSSGLPLHLELVPQLHPPWSQSLLYHAAAEA